MKRGHAHKTFVKIQRMDKVPQDFDDTPAQWVDIHSEQSVLASIRPVRGGEVVAGQKVEEGVTHTVEMRYVPGVRSDMSVLIDDQETPAVDRRRLHIAAVIDVKERHRDLVLTCEERP